ncbi:uncharacterized protein LOC107809981 isoform X1 [Nicotiana tabacum]|uniref:Uncharacterized protein LOC107809981 isoform X1 n=1 Tax=Nicotiana tabacum TaxID=4097 RepID=A0A1S4BMR6_TOBAC|nr:PREDICTED: uncharacterized protein LOC107809981 [Nicotiana tabacum]
MAYSNKINESIVRELIDILRINPYSFFIRSLIDIPELQNFHIGLKCDPGLDQRVYNLPTSSEVAAIWVENNDNSINHAPHIQIYTQSKKTQIVNYYYGCYDALQYPLLFPYGRNGWHYGIKKIPKPKNIRGSYTHECQQLSSIQNLCSLDSYLQMESQTLENGKKKKDTVSAREYYCYKLQLRNDDEDALLHTGRLFQQYSVDEYIKIETQRLDFASFNQDLFRMDILQGFLDILRFGERDSSNIGKQKFLSASFIGGPRDMRQRYMDAIALVRCFGKPDLFITMICNLTWTEIKEYLWTIDEAQNRPDLISRVFRAKVEELKTYISKRNIFGKIVAFMYTVEFQKRG